MARNTVFKNFRRLYTFQGVCNKSGRHIQSEDLTFLDQATMVVRQGRLLWVGHDSDLPSEFKKNSKTIRMNGRIGYPAFVECHTHSLFSGGRADEFEYRLQGVSYSEISKRGGGIVSTVKKVRESSPTDLVNRTQKNIDAFLRQGVTTVEIKSGYGLELKSEIKMLRAAQSLKRARIIPTYLGPHAKPPEFPTCGDYLEVVCKDLAKIRRYTNRADIFIENGFFEKPWAEKYLKMAQQLKFDLVVHAEQLSPSGGLELALKYFAKSADHLVHASAEDIEKMSQTETTAVLLPAADFYLKIEYPPARRMLDKGVRVALATDFNPGSSPTKDLAFVGLLARMKMKMTLAEVFAAYTVNAAYALGLEGDLGGLVPGKWADFFVCESEIEDFFYSVGEMPSMSVYREGKQIAV